MTAYPQSLLSPGEVIDFQTRPHFRALWAPAIALILITVIGTFLYTVTPWQPVKYGILGVALILIVPFVIVKFLRWLTTQYVFTNRRIITREGIIAKNGRDMPLAKVNNVSFDVSVMGRILNYGRLRVDSANMEGELIIDDVPNVEQVQRRIYSLYDADDARRRGTGGPGTLPPEA